MDIKPKTTREHIISLYGHIKGLKKSQYHMHQGIHELRQDRQDLLGFIGYGGGCITSSSRKSSRYKRIYLLRRDYAIIKTF